MFYQTYLINIYRITDNHNIGEVNMADKDNQMDPWVKEIVETAAYMLIIVCAVRILVWFVTGL